MVHFDLDAFFASVEELAKPWLRGKPVVVGALGGRGVVSTCNYAARKFGVRSGIAVGKAREMCPSCVFVPPSFGLYERASEKVEELIVFSLKKFCSDGASKRFCFERASIDEFYAEMGCESELDFAEAIVFAKELKTKIFAQTGLVCSVGVASNKFVAKMACKFAKPDGLAVVRSGEEKSFLEKMPIEILWGAGEKTQARLKQIGAGTIGDLAKIGVMRLLDEFGSYGSRLHFAANGVDDSPGGEFSATKSLGHERTFGKDVCDEGAARAAVAGLAGLVHAELAEENFFFRRVALKARFHDFETRTIEKTIRQSTDSLKVLEKTAFELLEQAWKESGGKKIRLLGVRASALSQTGGQLKLAQFA